MAYSVLDYVCGGCSLKFMVAIDFTDNQYEKAIKTVGSMLSHYDLEQQFPAFGFGAKLKPNGETKFCFPLKGKSGGLSVHGIKGVLNAYSKIVPKLTFGGPSRLSPVIHAAIDIVKKTPTSQQNQIYHVLMIVTDGVVNDLDETLQAVLESNSLPLSIVIVGIGPADFSAMDTFVAAIETLVQNKSMRNSTFAGREHVHFTALRKQKYATGFNTFIAKETLAKVSTQMVDYLKQHNIVPHRPTLNRTDPTGGGWVCQDMNLNSVTGDCQIQGSVTTTQDSSSSKRVHSMSFKNTLHLRGNTSTGTAAPTCPTCGSAIDSSRDPILDNGLTTFL